MPQLDVDKQIPADQPVQTTVVELTGPNAKTETEPHLGTAEETTFALSEIQP
jgi:hypothetical protein